MTSPNPTLRYVLALDTSEAVASAAVAQIEPAFTIVAHRDTPAGTAHELGLTICNHVLSDSTIEFSALSAIVIGHGPGSFTGLRVGYALAKGISCAQEIPLLSYSSFGGIANSILLSTPHSKIVVASDARRGDVFYSRYSTQNGIVIESISPKTISIAELCSILQDDQALKLVWRSETLPVELVPFLSQVLTTACSIAKGILYGVRENLKSIPRFSITAVGKMAPDYLRQSAAKTIEERMMARSQ